MTEPPQAAEGPFDAEALERARVFFAHPVRFLSASAAGDLCYAWDGELWLRPAGATQSHKLTVTAPVDRRDNLASPLDASGEIGEFALSPDGKEVAFVAAGRKAFGGTRAPSSPRMRTSISMLCGSSAPGATGAMSWQ